jgi:hypothetical protein
MRVAWPPSRRVAGFVLDAYAIVRNASTAR